jgi:hypothetical protein
VCPPRSRCIPSNVPPRTRCAGPCPGGRPAPNRGRRDNNLVLRVPGHSARSIVMGDIRFPICPRAASHHTLWSEITDEHDGDRLRVRQQTFDHVEGDTKDAKSRRPGRSARARCPFSITREPKAMSQTWSRMTAKVSRGRRRKLPFGPGLPATLGVLAGAAGDNDVIGKDDCGHMDNSQTTTGCPYCPQSCGELVAS